MAKNDVDQLLSELEAAVILKVRRDWEFTSDGQKFVLSPVAGAPMKRARREVETAGPRGYIAAARRFIAAAGRRAAEGDEVELRELLTLEDAVKAAEQYAVDGMRAQGRSWAYIAQATGKSREAAYQKWGKK